MSKAFSIFFAVCLCCSHMYAQDITISLPGLAQEQALNYYITDVQDKRPGKESIGKISDGAVRVVTGFENALEQQLVKRGEQTGKLPIVLYIRQFNVTEKRVSTKRQFDLDVIFAYYIGTNKLIEYKGSTFNQSKGEAQEPIQRLVAKTISDNLREFDAWLGKKRSNISVEPTVEVITYISKVGEKDDLIPYSKDTKLRISDFKAPPDETSPGAAATLSGVGMSFESSTRNNKTTVNVKLSVYFDRNRSWMKPEGKNNYILEHEQRHFDITAIKGCELKEMIEQTQFTPDGHKEQLKQLLDKIQEEGATLQNTYDAETEHGVNKKKQEEWNSKIREELSKQRCF